MHVEYAKAAPEDLVMRVTVHNRGPEAATVHLLPTLWFRNTWAWREGSDGELRRGAARRAPRARGQSGRRRARPARRRQWVCGGAPPVLFTENDTNAERLFGTENDSPYVKDGIGRYVVEGDAGAVNPRRSAPRRRPTTCSRSRRAARPPSGSG